MTTNQLIYTTTLLASQCIENIMKKPWIYYCKYGTELWYKCDKINDSRILLTFKGGTFRKMMRTTYIVDFVQTPLMTKIVMMFYKEMLGLPALTPPNDIDEFMNQKANARKT